MSDSVSFPPATFTTPVRVLPAYPYQEYADDDNVSSFFYAYNILAQQYLNWFNEINLPIYTGLGGSLLDWVAQGLYGIARPSLASGQLFGVGPLATWTPATWVLASFQTIGSIQNPAVTDDIFKRIITWFFFKGDGQKFCTAWLKRRIMRFLTCPNGTAPNIDNTYPISITFNGGGSITITITLTDANGIPLSVAQIFQTAVSVGVLSFPFQLSEIVVIVDNIGPTGLSNNNNMLQVNTATGWPVSPMGLADGALWYDNGVAAIIPGAIPDPFSQPQFYGLITSGGLLIIGGGNLPLSDPHVVDQLWNDGGIIAISNG